MTAYPFLSNRYAHYHDRQERNQFCADFIVETGISGRILNVGSGGERFLQKALDVNEVVDMDLRGDVDYKINLETDLPLPFKDKDFELSVCLDVLEHLETFHDVFYELLRVSEKYVFISLPIPSSWYFRNLLFNKKHFENERDRFGKYEKYYGLPYEKPDDRHKWFFCFDEAMDFFRYHSRKQNYQIEEVFFRGKGDYKHKVLRKIAPRLYRNFIPGAFWVILRI